LAVDRGGADGTRGEVVDDGTHEADGAQRFGVRLFLSVLQIKEGRARQDSNLRPAD